MNENNIDAVSRGVFHPEWQKFIQADTVIPVSRFLANHHQLDTAFIFLQQSLNKPHHVRLTDDLFEFLTTNEFCHEYQCLHASERQRQLNPLDEKEVRKSRKYFRKLQQLAEETDDNSKGREKESQRIDLA